MRDVLYFPDPPTGLDYTHVPRVMLINTPDGVLRFFGDSAFANLFKTYNVNGDGNCAFYCVQLFVEWKYSLGNEDTNAVVSVAAFRQQFRQHLQDVGVDYYSRYLTRPNHNQILKQIYDPTIRNVMDYYNFVATDSVLPQHQWGTDDYIQIIARWFNIGYVVIFSKDYATIADLTGDEFQGKAPIKLYVSSNDSFMDMLLSMPRNDTMFLYHTGNHYMWLKVDESLLPQAVVNSHSELIGAGKKMTPTQKKRKSSQGDNKSETSSDKSPIKSPDKSPIKSPDKSPIKPCIKSPSKSPPAKSPVLCNFCLSRNRECIICADQPPNIAFVPCGHVMVCQGCLTSSNSNSEIKISVCPYCRTPITGTLRVYL